MKRFLFLLLLGTFLAVAYVALMAGAEAGRGQPAFSVFSNEDDGLATAARVLQKLGFEPVAVTRPIHHTRREGLLIVVEPRQDGFFGTVNDLSDADAQGLLGWVEKGNTLVLMGRHSTALHKALGVAVERPKKGGPDDVVRTADADEVRGYTVPDSSGLTFEVRRVAVEGQEFITSRKGLPLWPAGDGQGSVLLAHGQGQVLVVSDPSLWTHRGLLRNDNVLLMYNVAALNAAGGRVYFDEYHHGIRSSGGYWDYLRYHDLHWTVLQALAVVAVALWAVAVRLGPAVALPKPAGADAVVYASAVARIYHRAGVPHLLAQNMVRDFLGALTRHLRLRRTTMPAQIVAVWRQHRGKESAERLTELLRGVAELRQVAAGRETTERDLLAWSRAFDQFVAEHRLTVKD
jgi:hypothetical protein